MTRLPKYQKEQRAPIVENTDKRSIIEDAVEIKERVSKDIKSLHNRANRLRERETTIESISNKDVMKTNFH